MRIFTFTWTVAALIAGVALTDDEFDADTDDLTTKTTTQAAPEHKKIGFGLDLEEFDVDIGGPSRADVDEAVDRGLNLMRELYLVKEPQLYRLGLYLSKNEPAARVAAFSEPNPRAIIQARYGYAAVQAALRLKEKYPETRSRRNPEHVSFVRAALLQDQCPIRGVPRCPPAARRYRTADGTCNNPEHPWKGASMLPMQRFLMPVYEDGVQSVRRSVRGSRLPSAREISVRIHRDRNVEMSSVTMMFMQWGQFVDHDVTSTAQARAFNGSVPRCCARGGAGFLPPELTHPECLPIPVSDDDWFLGRFGVRCLEFIRSAPSSRIDCDLGWREQINQVTSYIDASTVYGSDPDRADSLRLFRRGLLQYGRPKQRDQNPPDPPGGEICHMGALSTQCFRGGDSRVGEQPGLTAFHTVFLRYHNRLATILNDLNPHWSDEKIYQETRRIVAASIQHITYREFLPIVLGQEVMELFDLGLERKGYYEGYDARVNPTPANSFSSAAFRFGHSLVQNSYVRSDGKHRPLFNNVTIHEEQDNPENIWSFGSVDRLILGFSNQASQRRDEFICRELTHHLFQAPGDPFGMDLAAVNIQRGRDHGIPSYTSWREPCGLVPVRTWEDLEPLMSFETIQRFRSLYEHIDDIDLYPGGLAEKPVRGGVVGPTFACIIAQQFSNFRKADRFWYENGDFESSFTPAQLQQIRRMTFSQVLCEVLPEIETIQPFVFLSPDNFRNARMSCDRPELANIDMRAWQERRSANLVQETPTKNTIPKDKPGVNNKLDLNKEREMNHKVSVDNKLELLEDIDDKLDFGDDKKDKGSNREELSSTTRRINDKISFGATKPPKISDKLAFGPNKGNNKKDKVSNTTPKINDKLSFASDKNKGGNRGSSKFKEELSTTHKINDGIDFGDATTPKAQKHEDFDVLFFVSKRGEKKREDLDVEWDQFFDDKPEKIKRSLLDYYDDDDEEGKQSDYDDDFSRKRKKKKKPKIRTTTPQYTTKSYRPDYVLNPLKIKVRNISSSMSDIIGDPYRRYSTPKPNEYQQTTRRQQQYGDDYVLHPTITKDGKKYKRPELQVNINIQYMSTTPKTNIKVNQQSGRPNVHIIENSYATQGYYDQSTRRPISIVPVRTTKRPTDYYRPTYDDEPYFVSGRPTYNYDRYENRPFSTSRRPYIYKPSQGYLSMFDELHTTTRRTIYMQGYVNKVSRPPTIPSYLYLDKYYQDDKDEQNSYRYKTNSKLHYVGEEGVHRQEEGGYRQVDRDKDDHGEKNYVKISSVQGNEFLMHGNKEHIINIAQQKEGDLDLYDSIDPLMFNTEDDDIEKLLVDVIPRESRKDDWMIFNELKEDALGMENPVFRNATNDTNTAELPKPLKLFWNKQDAKESPTKRAKADLD